MLSTFSISRALSPIFQQFLGLILRDGPLAVWRTASLRSPMGPPQDEELTLVPPSNLILRSPASLKAKLRVSKDEATDLSPRYRPR
jgi:hypothetical protein